MLLQTNGPLHLLLSNWVIAAAIGSKVGSNCALVWQPLLQFTPQHFGDCFGNGQFGENRKKQNLKAVTIEKTEKN